MKLFGVNYLLHYVSEAESWRPIAGHRVNRYRTDLRLSQRILSGHPKFNQQQQLCIQGCSKILKTQSVNILSELLLRLRSVGPIVDSDKELRLTARVLEEQLSSMEFQTRKETKRAYHQFRPAKSNLSNDELVPLGFVREQKLNPNPDRESGSGPLEQKRSRRSPGRTEIKPSVDKEEPLGGHVLKWVPVSLAPPTRDEDVDTKSNLVTQNLVNNFVTSSLPDLKLPQESTGTIVQIVSPLLTKNPDKWGSTSSNPQKHTQWHKKPTVILVHDTPQELLPKPIHQYQHYHHQDPEPEPVPSPEPVPRPTYHYPRPSPEPPPKPIYHYPPSTHRPIYHDKPSSHKPIYHYYPSPEPQFPYTSVTVHTTFHPDPDPEPSPDISWQSQSHHPLPEPEPEIIIANSDPVPEPPALHDEPSGPSPPSFSVAPPSSPLNPTTITTGQKPPAIVILSSPEDDPPASVPLDDPVPAAGGGGSGGGGALPLIPIIPPIIPGIPVSAAPGLIGSVLSAGPPVGSSDCPSVQVFNVQSMINNIEDKDCQININSAINNNGQVEPPVIQSDPLDDDIPDTSTVATTTKKPSSDSSMGVFDYIASFFASLTLFNPISLSFWSFLFAPLSVLLASGLGLAALILPWFFPSYWVRRRSDNRRNDYVKGPYRIRGSALRFERSLRAGMDLDSFLDSIGLL